ncbi:putative tRNA-dihydrouridine synthase [Reticulibacter mediterranei]|uniref:tRNA-dihydrouridine synthase n=1 Tax=Reticulibacter mediterranei TaxID=2778369 RepID=A0A8J3II34_9CHLR|nr:tRNA-dihydrouridine synthase [Reticulibacter mediterranei]GHO91759.1 putative tRNA-dihydrouridine synthase [Reticulibacter mediterranei]
MNDTLENRSDRSNFWQRLEKPIFVLAPMDDVTDTVLRQVIARCGKPAVFFTEFTNVEGMFSKGERAVMSRLQYTEIERPLVAQIWGSKPENFYRAAKKLIEMGFDGIDLNMGCPASGVLQKGVCSGLINNRPLAKEIIIATKEGAAGIIPVSVKTRLGFRAIDFDWIRFVLEQDPAVLTVHARTVSEMSKVPAHWDKLKTVVDIRNEMQSNALIIGNGDIKSLGEARQKVAEAGADGAMIGRGIFENPYLFSETITLSDKTPEEKMQLLLEHMQMWTETWGETKHFPILRKFFKVYASGFPGAQDLRMQLMETQNPEETKQVVTAFVHDYAERSLSIH